MPAGPELGDTDRALLDSRDALRLALAAGRLGTWRWDMGTGAVRFDNQLEAIFGLPVGGFDGRFESYQALLHPDDRDYVLDVVRSAVAAKSDYDVEHRCVWPDGSVHWLQGRGSVTLHPDGEVSGTVGCVGDVTDRVLARVQAAQLSATLQAGLLPLLASPPGMNVRSRYRPGEERLLLGGDFLDVVMTPSGNVGFCIGSRPLFEGYSLAGLPERMGIERIERWCSELGGAPWAEHHLDELLAFVEDANGGPLGDDIGVLSLSSSISVQE